MSPAHAYTLYVIRYTLYVTIPNMVVKLPLASVTLTSAVCIAYKCNKICQRLYGYKLLNDVWNLATNENFEDILDIMSNFLLSFDKILFYKKRLEKKTKISQRSNWRKFNSYIHDMAFLHCNRLKIAMRTFLQTDPKV
uniref:Uncharacterized protein n=1 Tax=Glossina austeni TaxID=7395 RepID=A0A1A9V5I9_GLOAU